MQTLNISNLWSIPSYLSVIIMSFLVIYLSAGYHVCHRILMHYFRSQNDVHHLRASPPYRHFFMWLFTHRQNSSKSYLCLSWGLQRKNEFALGDIPSFIQSVLTFRVLASITPNLRNAYKYSTHTHDITCLQQSTQYTWCENINDILDLFCLLPQTTLHWLTIYKIFKYFAFHIESIWWVCVLGIHAT